MVRQYVLDVVLTEMAEDALEFVEDRDGRRERERVRKREGGRERARSMFLQFQSSVCSFFMTRVVRLLL